MTWALMMTAALAAPQTYEVVPGDSTLFVQVFKDEEALFSGMSHDHVVRATKFSGRITADPDAPGDCRGRVVVPAASLENDEPELRKRVGYDSEIDEDDREAIKETMLGGDVLDVDTYPEISFTAEACMRDGDALTLAGRFEMHGRAKTLEVPLKLEMTSDQVRVRAVVPLRHADFGMEPVSFFMGAVRNAEEMKLHVDLVFRATGAAGP